MIKKFENFEEDFEETDNNNIIKRYVDNTETDDLPDVLYRDLEERFGFNYETDDIKEAKRNNGHYWMADSYPMKIDEVIRLLELFKEKGADYVAIDYHMDHQTYLFDAIKFELE